MAKGTDIVIPLETRSNPTAAVSLYFSGKASFNIRLKFDCVPGLEGLPGLREDLLLVKNNSNLFNFDLEKREDLFTGHFAR